MPIRHSLLLACIYCSDLTAQPGLQPPQEWNSIVPSTARAGGQLQAMLGSSLTAQIIISARAPLALPLVPSPTMPSGSLD